MTKEYQKAHHTHKAKSLPAMMFYPGDWLRDPNLRRCSFAAKGVWMDLLCYLWFAEERGKLPWSDEDICNILGWPKVVESALSELQKYGVLERDSDGNLCSRRMIRDEKIRETRAKGGKLGGNPNLMKVRRKVNLIANHPPNHGVNLSPEYENVIENEVVIEAESRKGVPGETKIQFGEAGRVWLTEAQSQKVRDKFGDVFFERCVEKLDSWIEQDPSPKRIKNGKNGAATFRAWVIAAVAEEQNRADSPTKQSKSRPAGNGLVDITEHNMAVFRQFQGEK